MQLEQSGDMNRRLKRHPVLAALAFSVVAEGVCVAVLSLPDTNPFVDIIRSIVGAFHILPGLACFYLSFFPDVIDGYASSTEESIVAAVIYLLAWMQWFLIFLGGIHMFRPHNENLAA